MVNRFIAAASLPFLISGCATVLQGTTDEITLVLHGDPQKQASCTLSDENSIEVALEAGVPLSITRTSDDLTIECKQGDSSLEHQVHSSFSSAWLLTNFLMDFCIITCPVDLATGAFYDYPNEVVISFGDEGLSQ